MTREAFARAIPKAELHLHLEGTLEPELMLALAQRNGMTLPYPDVQALRQAYAFTDLQSFLDIYYAGASVLRQEQDFFDMAWAYAQRAHADGVWHAEVFFDPQTHTSRGVPIGTVIAGLSRASAAARTTLGLEMPLILCFLRHLSEEEAFATLEDALPYREHFIGIGLDSSERGHPPEKFARVFERCRALGFHLTAHAGEEGPASYVWQALDLLHVSRIDHGVRCLEDPELVAELVRRRVPLTVCPLSNVKLCVVPELGGHPLRRMLEAGLKVTVNADDPAYFGGYVGDNWVHTAEALDLDRDALIRLARHSFEACWVSPGQRARYLSRLDEWLRNQAPAWH